MLLTLMCTFLLHTVDRGIWDKVLSSLGLLGWFRHAYFEPSRGRPLCRGGGGLSTRQVCT